MNITYFQRKRRVSSYSLEFIFDDLRKRLNGRVQSRVKVAPFFSNGFFRRLGIMLSAKLHEGDINHVTGDINFVSLMLRKKRTVLTILDCGDVENRTGIRGWLLRKLWFSWPARQCSVITTISEASRSAILRVTDCPPKKIIVVPVAVSDVFRHVPGISHDDRPRILQVGTSPNKNLERVIEALHGLPCTLSIIGELSPAQRQQLNAAQIVFENHVGLTVEELARQYESCDLVVFASLFEGFGMPIVEAQSVGRPVITSNMSSMPEVAGDGACLVDPLSVRSIRQGIIRVLNDSHYAEELVRSGLKNAKRFDAAEIARQYYEIYQKVHHEAAA